MVVLNAQEQQNRQAYENMAITFFFHQLDLLK